MVAVRLPTKSFVFVHAQQKTLITSVPIHAAYSLQNSIYINTVFALSFAVNHRRAVFLSTVSGL